MTTIHSTTSQFLVVLSGFTANIAPVPDPTLRPDLALLARIVYTEPPDVQELFQYAVTMLLIEDGKAQIVERCQLSVYNDKGWFRVGDDWFNIHKSDIPSQLFAVLYSYCGAGSEFAHICRAAVTI